MKIKNFMLIQLLIGLPVYEYKIKKAEVVAYATDKTLEHLIKQGWELINEPPRTSYAKPNWIHGKEAKPVLLFLDDYNRSF